ncbi:discoidin domain-containing protein [Streptomyces sp. NPDC003247]|uniref:galactose-binding domain-containing protein n=1 Tax=Streptomyces sp. NPDC003247 TaxID=3364677 RepID=UPI0036C953B2
MTRDNDPRSLPPGPSRRVFLGAVSLTALGAALPSAVASPAWAGTSAYSAFPVGGTWLDTSGKAIQAHGGGYLKVGPHYYWVGEDKSDDSALFSNIALYRSADLLNWTFVNNILTKDSAPALNSCKIERPKLVYNEATRTFVLWGHWENAQDYSASHLMVATCDTVGGDYVFQRHFRPGAGTVASTAVDPTYTAGDGLYGHASRDFTVYKDPDSTTAYLISTESGTDMRVYRLSTDYQDVDWGGSYPLFVGKRREAPAMVKVGDRYFLLTSAQSGWYPNQCLFAYTDDPDDPDGWSALAPVGNNTTFYSQPGNILTVETKTGPTRHIYLGDRWNPAALGSSTYVWLPLSFTGVDGSSPGVSMPYLPSWSVNHANGAVRTPSNTLVSQGRPVTATASDAAHAGSVANDGNFFNLNTTGDSSSYFKPAAVPFDWTVDLGSAQELSRIDISWRAYNGSETYAGYTVSGSTDGTSWTTLTDRSDNTVVGFTSDALNGTCRYVRLSVSKVVNDHNKNSATWAAGLVEVQIYS